MAKDAFNRRHWWKRIFLSTISGKLLKDMRERTWTRAVLTRFVEFQWRMLIFAVKGELDRHDS